MKGRERTLKYAEFPHPATITPFTFGELDVIQDGKGLEAHPRLTIGTIPLTMQQL